MSLDSFISIQGNPFGGGWSIYVGQASIWIVWPQVWRSRVYFS